VGSNNYKNTKQHKSPPTAEWIRQGYTYSGILLNTKKEQTNDI
jgi:hypothetical protein